MKARLSLGTVQFGMPYGIANAGSHISDAAIRAILHAARDADVKVIDTAAQYGLSEAKLGAQDLRGFDIITKTVAVSGLSPKHAAQAIDEGVRQSAKHLKTATLGGLLVHNAADLLGSAGDEIFRKIVDLRQAQRTAKIGVSVYETHEIDEIVSRFDVDIIQLPVNVLDQRFVAGGQIAALAERGIEVHARSAYLQGLLLMDKDALPSHLTPYRSILDRWRAAAAAQGMTLREAALSYVSELPGVRYLVVGAFTPAQFIETATAFRQSGSFQAADLASNELNLVDPRRWPSR